MPTTIDPLTGQAAIGWESAYGGVPRVPDPTAAARRSVEAAAAGFPETADLARRVSDLLWQEYTGRLPGYADMARQASANIAAALRGEVPADVRQQIAQAAAERGVMRGLPGSELSTADWLRSLGLTSLGLQQWGQQALGQALQRGAAVPVMDPTKYMVTPEQLYQAQLAANIYAAAPLPGPAARQAVATAREGLAATSPRGGAVVTMPQVGYPAVQQTAQRAPSYTPVMATGTSLWSAPSTWTPVTTSSALASLSAPSMALATAPGTGWSTAPAWSGEDPLSYIPGMAATAPGGFPVTLYQETEPYIYGGFTGFEDTGGYDWDWGDYMPDWEWEDWGW